MFSRLGLRRAGPSPRARLLSPPDLMAKVARTLIDAMRQWSNLRRDRLQFILPVFRMDQFMRLPGWDEQRDDGGDGDGGQSQQEGRAER